jgi:hypothetical protein
MTFPVSTTRFARTAAILAACACVVAVGGCGNKKKDPANERKQRAEHAVAVEGLDALPADVRVVVGANVPALAASPLVKDAFARMLGRDQAMAARLGELQTRCKLDPGKDLESVLVGLLGSTSSRDVVLVAKGKLDETAIVACVEATLTEKGGKLEKKTDGALSVYVAHNPQGSGDIAFGFGAPGVILLADSEELLHTARDAASPKLKSNKDFVAMLAETDTRAALWGVGLVAPDVGRGIVDAASGKVKKPAQAMWGSVDLSTGLALELVVKMDADADAKGLAEVVQKQLGQYAIVAQAYALGPIVNKIKTETRGPLFVVTLALDAGELAKLQTLLDKDSTRAPTGAPESGQGKEGTSP